MARAAWIIDGHGLAKMVKNSGPCAAHEIKDCGASVQCHNCLHMIDISHVSGDMPGFPAGVKFDPSDVELLDHLAAKCGVGNMKPQSFIDEFIPTLDGDKGILYTHPEYLPGAKKDGSSVHFFYKITNAYNIGKRKRRKIQGNGELNTPTARWHKTGKTKAVMENGIHKGIKKILVLYSTAKNGANSVKYSWVMHQFHLGSDEDEKEGIFVVAKIFYQRGKEGSKKESLLGISESDVAAVQLNPMTPNMSAPDPPREEKTPASDCGANEYFVQQHVQDLNDVKNLPHHCGFPAEDGEDYTSCLARESQDIDLSEIPFLLCDEILESQAMADIFKPNNGLPTQAGEQTNNTHQRDGTGNASYGLENIRVDSPPDFKPSDLQFTSQDNLFDWGVRM